MKNINRRDFIKASLLTTASAALLPSLTACRIHRPSAAPAIGAGIRGANEDIRVAVVGFNSRGMDAIRGLSKLKGVRLVALCDVDRNVLDREVKKLRDNGQSVEAFTDYRRLLESKDIDAVALATPNHWHALGAIWGVQAGKDVYVEKPVSHNVWEGRQIVAAARKHNRIVQTGTQSRSNPGLREAVAWLHEGNLGKIRLARGLCYKRRASIGKTSGPQPVPESIDYDLWTGPAPMAPLRRAKLHYDWHWQWEAGNGDLGNQGVHQVDIARWILGEKALSPKVFTIGGRLGYDDDGTTPNTLAVFHQYEKAPLIFEVRGLPSKSGSEEMNKLHGASVGVIIECEHGRVVIPSYSKAIIQDTDGKEIRTFEGSGDHYQNFINAVRSRKASDLNADILEGHISSALCHTGNISHRIGRQSPPNELREVVRGDAEAGETLGRMLEHLRVNEVDAFKNRLTLGAHLKMNPASERFTNNRQANALLTREYRKPFVVPKHV